MRRIVIVGSSGHARVVADLVEREGRYKIVGLLDKHRQLGEQTSGYQVLGREEDLPALVGARDVRGVIVAIGDNFVRAAVSSRIRELCPDLKFVSAIHPMACVAREVVIGDGTVIVGGAVVNPCARIGVSCIINTCASLDHDSTMGDYASLAPHASVGGNCTVREYAAIGIGAAVIHGRLVGEHSVIGAGATVVGDIAPYTLAYGTPAVRVRERRAGERYL